MCTLKKIIFFVALSFFYCPDSMGQGIFFQEEKEIEERAKENLVSTLIAKGFQNISIAAEDSTLHLTLENRLYRSETAAIKKIISLIAAESYSSYQHIELTLQNQGIPFSKVDFSNTFNKTEGLLNYHISSYTSDIQSYWRTYFLQNQFYNKGQYRFELEFEPQLKLALGSKEDAIKHQINLLPNLNFYLWKGAQLNFQGILPISSEWNIPEDKFWRPYRITFRQYVSLAPQTLLRGTIGYFTNRRYGAELALHKLLGQQGNYAIEAQIAYTGFASFPKVLWVEEPEKGWQIGDVNYLSYGIGLEYRIPKWNTRFSLKWRKNLLDQKLVRAEVWRQFKELQIGFFAYQYEGQRNYGFDITIPIFPKKYAKPKWLQIKPSRFLRYTYHTTQNYVSDFSTGVSWWDFYKNTNASFLHQNLNSNNF